MQINVETLSYENMCDMKLWYAVLFTKLRTDINPYAAGDNVLWTKVALALEGLI